MRISELCSLIEQFAPLSLQEPYDNAGLLLGNSQEEIKGVLICLDVSLPVIEEAISLGCNVIVSHHPLIFSGLKHLTGESAVERCVLKAIEHRIAVYAGHTNVDAVANGVSAKMCEKLGLSDCKVLSPQSPSDLSSVGLGMLGHLPQEMDEISFLSLVESTFSCKMLRHSEFTGRKIRQVALCGGSGSEFIDEAIAKKADAYITADLKYHDFSRVTSELLLVDAGHYETEQFTKEIFFDLLSKNISTFAVRISIREQNPVKIHISA